MCTRGTWSQLESCAGADDVQAHARLAAAESGVKAAQAQLDAATHNGTLQERQGAAADLARTRIDRDQPVPVSMLSPGSNPPARFRPAR